MASSDISVATSPPHAARRDTLLLWLVPAAAYYAFLLTAGSSGLFAPVQHGLTFNSMLLHMLAGRFDVDPAAIGDEGFLHNGAVYAYFGIFPALFRALFLWVPNFAQTDFTRLACLTAVSGMAVFKLLSVLTVWRSGGERRDPRLLTLLTVAILLSGSQIEFLRPSIFQEVEQWAAMFGAAFVYLTLRGLSREEGFSPGLLTGLGGVAALCLLSRVSNAIGLYAAFGLIWLYEAWRRRADRAALVKLLGPAAVVLLGAALTGLVNYQRWGNPLTFVDLSAGLIFKNYPEQLAALKQSGAFNLNRIGFALVYYFMPLWVLRDAAGDLWWGGFWQHQITAVELPPASFFLTDPLLIGLAVLGLGVAWRGRKTQIVPLLALLGLLASVALMLCAPSMTMRYRVEFYPFIELAAFLGFARLLTVSSDRTRIMVGAGAVIGVIGSHLTWLLYMLSPFGPAARVLEPSGIVSYYQSLFH